LLATGFLFHLRWRYHAVIQFHLRWRYHAVIQFHLRWRYHAVMQVQHMQRNETNLLFRWCCKWRYCHTFPVLVLQMEVLPHVPCVGVANGGIATRSLRWCCKWRYCANGGIATRSERTHHRLLRALALVRTESSPRQTLRAAVVQEKKRMVGASGEGRGVG
jgi:hypothetical protein